MSSFVMPEDDFTFLLSGAGPPLARPPRDSGLYAAGFGFAGADADAMATSRPAFFAGSDGDPADASGSA